MQIEVTEQEAQAIITALAMQHPLVKKLADQVTAHQLAAQAQPNGEDKTGDPRMAHIVRGTPTP